METLKTLIYYKKELKKIDGYLKPGFYILNVNNGRSFISKRRNTALPVDKTSFARKVLLNLLKPFFIYKSKKYKKVFCGEAVYFNNTSGKSTDIKIFDFHNNKILTVFLNNERYYLVKKKYIIGSCFFPTNQKAFNDETFVSEEDIIDSFRNENISKDCLTDLILFYKKLYKNTGMINGIIKDNKYICHGDLSVDNFDYKKDRKKHFLFIDFDWISYNHKYYDVFFLIFNTAFNGNDQFIKYLYQQNTFKLFEEEGGVVKLLNQFKKDVSKRTHLYEKLINDTLDNFLLKKIV